MTDLRANLGAHRAKTQEPVPDAKRRAGRNARKRGNAWEVELVHLLGAAFPDIKRVGMYGGPDDVSSRLLYIQAKKVAGLYPKGADALLTDTEQHANADQFTAVAYAHPGHTPRHKLIVMDVRDFANLLLRVQGEALEKGAR